MTARQVVGIDGYRHGWVAALLHGDHLAWRTADVPDVASLVLPSFTVAIDMPIGLLDVGERECDRLARAHLPGAASRVFTTPPRRVLELGLAAPNDTVQLLSLELMGKGVSRQALGLASRILALDAVVAANPEADVIEAHPEVSFCAMAGSGPLAGKKAAAGVGQRVAALRTWLPDVDHALSTAPDDVPIDDALDALACLWTAERWRSGVALAIPEGAAHRPFIAV